MNDFCNNPHTRVVLPDQISTNKKIAAIERKSCNNTYQFYVLSEFVLRYFILNRNYVLVGKMTNRMS